MHGNQCLGPVVCKHTVLAAGNRIYWELSWISCQMTLGLVLSSSKRLRKLGAWRAPKQQFQVEGKLILQFQPKDEDLGRFPLRPQQRLQTETRKSNKTFFKLLLVGVI